MDAPHTLHPTPAPTLDDTVYLSDEEGETVSSDTDDDMESSSMSEDDDERYPDELIGKILLELYWSFSDYDPQRGEALHRTLAACHLVCHQWSWIVQPIEGSFFIQAYGKEWLSPSFPYRILPRTPLLLTDEGESNQEGNAGWLPENYTTALSQSHPKFLSELTSGLIPGIYAYEGAGLTMYEREKEKRSIIKSTLTACCLVSHEWNRIFTPILYKDILLKGKNSLLTRSLLHRTFQHTKPTHKALVRTMSIELAEDGSTANSLSICFSFPNLYELIINLLGVDPTTLHSNFAQNLQSLSRCCSIQMRGHLAGEIWTQWPSLPIWINFIRRSRSIPCGFATKYSGDKIIFYLTTHFYIGKQEALAHGATGSSDTKRFKQHLTQTGHNLRGLYLNPSNPDSLPEIDLRKNPHLRLLQFDFSFDEEKIRGSQDDVIRWFSSICESVTSKSLVVCMYGLFNESEICSKIQETLLALHTRIETLSIYLSTKCFPREQNVDLEDVRKLFSRLYEAGIVIEKWLGAYEDEACAIAFGR